MRLGFGSARGVDLCITGEGKLDAGTAHGKTVAVVARACREAGVPCVALAGTVEQGAEAVLERGLSAYFGICDGPMVMEEAMRRAGELLRGTAANVMRVARTLVRTRG